MKRTPLLLALLHTSLFLGVGPLLAQAHTTGDFHGCPPEGSGTLGRFDPDLDRLKNRDLPPNNYAPTTLSAVLLNRPSAAIAMGKRPRATWSADALEAVREPESRGAQVIGRLIAIRAQGPEACNCGSPTDVDTHMWIAAQATAAAKPRSMVVEISPRLLGQHPGWKGRRLVALAKAGTPVRISGWITWDQEHGSEVGKSRGTLWEIHPVHRIEFFAQGVWYDLDAQ